ncbi:MAG: DUF4271 domain-containing protein [Burkholderiales bacterium]|nr:DUF4271 domain-containing protein [Bacteroidia bacterium]
MKKQDSVLSEKNDSLLNDTSLPNKASIFYNHSLKAVHHSPIFKAGSPSYWQGILLFIIFSVYVLIKISEPKKILKIFASVFSLQEAKQLFREEFKLAKRMSLFMAICFILVVAFLIQITNNYFGLILKDYSPIQQYLFFILVICLSYLTKFLVNYVLAFIVLNNELGKEYMFSVVVFSQTIGIILFPFIVCIQFTHYPTEWFLYPSLIICCGFYTLRMFRGFILSNTEQNIGILYIFLYLCALEILPLLILIKFLLINF